MATGPHVHGSTPNPIAAPDGATPAESEDDKAKAAEAAEAKAAESKANAADERHLIYTVPAQAAGKAVTRASSEAHAHASRADASSYANRVGVGAALATISSDQWAKLGVPDAPSTQWDSENNWSIPVKDMVEAQVNYLLDVDPKYNSKRFALVDGNGKPAER